MLIVKCNVAIIAILFSPLGTVNDLTSQLHNSLNAQLVGVSDEARVSIRITPNLPPPCEQPLSSMSNNSRLWGNVNVLACRGNDKRYLQVNVQTTGNYVITAMPVAWGGKLGTGNIGLKRGRLDTLPPCVTLDINQLVDAISLRDLSPDQPIQLTQFCQVWWVEAGQRVNVTASGSGFSANAESQALNSAAVAQNARVYMVPGQVVSGVTDTDGNILINL